MRILVNDFSGHPFQLQLSRAFAAEGHEVEHVYFAANNTPKGAVTRLPGDPGNFTIRGLAINCAFRKHSLLKRRQADIAYGKTVAARVVAFRPDAVISSNMPVDGQSVLLQAARENSARFVFWLQDVYCTAIEFVLRKKGIPFAWLAAAYYRHLEKDLLRRSDAVVCIAPEFLKTVTEWGVAHNRTFVIENWAALNEVQPSSKDNRWSRQFGFNDKFCFMYSGTLGMKHNPELLLKLARLFEGRLDVAIVVIADGAGADWLKQQQQFLRTKSLRILPFQPYQRLSEVLGTADVLISILDSECGAFAVPSKTLTYLCAGRPLLVAAPRENLASKLVIRANAGVVIPPNDPDVFVSTARKLMDDREGRRQFGLHARRYAERTFEIDHIRDQFMDVLARAGCRNLRTPVSLEARV